jgi:hypothetical protein
MELRDFVKESLIQIVHGVSDAQLALAESKSNGAVSPEIRNNWGLMESKGVLLTQAGVPVQSVEFDVSVTASEGTGTKGSIGITVAILGLKSEGQSSQSNANTSRLKFSVPISLPTFPSTKS